MKSNLNDLASMMVGREVNLVVDKTDSVPGEIILEVENLRVLDPIGAIAVDNMSV